MPRLFWLVAPQSDEFVLTHRNSAMIAMWSANSFKTMGKLLGPFSGRSCQFRNRVYAMEMKVTAVVHQAEEGGFWAEVPSLPGCRTQGDTMDELKSNLREAVELYLDV